MPTETAFAAERFQSVLKHIRRNLNKTLAKKITKAFEEDPDASFERVVNDALDSYRVRIANARRTGEQRLVNGKLFRVYIVEDYLTCIWSSEPTVNPQPKPKVQLTFGHEFPSATVTVLSELSPTLQVLLHIHNIPSEDQAQTIKNRLSELIDRGTCLHSTPARRIVRLDDATVVKFGPFTGLDELALLNYVSEHTDIPIPCPLGCMQIGKTCYIFTAFVAGETLERRWATLTVAQKVSVRCQLNSMLSRLRSLPYPDDTPLGTLSIPHVCKDYTMAVTVSPPNITSVSQFHDFLVSHPHPNVAPSYLRWLRAQLRDDYRIVLTHGDFHPRNVIVTDSLDGTVHITAIIDWEMGGWYPEYWEMYKAVNTRGGDDDSDWWDHFPEIISGFDREILERRVVEQSMRP
ncbi:hypothetical protein EIP86_007949 [Pleurotus ostreatoroseus]|nr:hypothetical protein EIP86_007949 [Pleurotus ostreatoroseus]